MKCNFTTSRMPLAKILGRQKLEDSSQRKGICYHHFSVTNPCPILCNTIDCNTPGSPGLYYLPEFAQIHVH